MINRKQWFGIAWRLALLAMPWQTRWIASIGVLSGNTWEQGTVAIYASWVLMIAAIALGASLRWPFRRTFNRDGVLGLIAIGLFFVASVFTSAWISTLLWWAHVIMLAAFAWTLWANGVGRMEFATWFVIAVIPQAILGVWQFLQQKVDGSTLFGIATQRGWVRGASVVEYGEFRILRAYAGFPHPNVFGGWLAAGVTLLPFLMSIAKTLRDKFAWIVCGALMLMALVFSFSRGAWLAAAVGLIVSFILVWKRTQTKTEREPLLIAALVFIAIVAVGLTSQWEAVATRFQAQAQLEQWSVEERVTSIKDGFIAFTHRPIFGWGPGASLVGIADLNRPQPAAMTTFDVNGKWATFHAPLEPPHAAPLAAAVETGIVGILAMLILVYLFFKHLWESKQLVNALPILLVAGGLAATDHYLWTLWAGQALAMILVIIPVLTQKGE